MTKKLMRNLWYNTRNKISAVKQGVKNLIIWFPVIWKVRYYDYCYLYGIMNKQISLMLEDQKSIADICQEAESTSKQMQKVVYALKRLELESDYPNVNRNFYFSSTEPYEAHGKIEEINKNLRKYMFNMIEKHINKWWT